MAVGSSLKKIMFHILILGVAGALVLDAVNLDDLCLPRGMIHEEYCGERMENFSTSEQSQQAVEWLTAVHPQAYRQAHDVPGILFLVDEDSPSLPAHPTITREMINTLSEHIAEKSSQTYIHSYNFYYFCKLQI